MIEVAVGIGMLALFAFGFACGMVWLVMFVSECIGEHRLWRLEGEMELVRRLIEDRRFVVIDTATGMAYSSNDGVEIRAVRPSGGQDAPKDV